MPGEDRSGQGDDGERRQVARRTKRQRSNVGFAGTASRMGMGESGEERGRGRGGAEGAGEAETGDRRELASPSANFITELVVFAQIISIYSTQAGNLFASECMREWNLPPPPPPPSPPRSRLARARMCMRARVCRSGVRNGRAETRRNAERHTAARKHAHACAHRRRLV